MKRNFAGLAGFLALVLVDMHAPTPADACGVKLTIKTSAPRKAASHDTPHVLFVGRHSSQLERSVSSSGADVESTQDPSSAKRKSYNAVYSDEAHADQARQTFGDNVIVASGDDSADQENIEARLSRRPTRASNHGGLKATSSDGRTLVAVGPQPKPGEQKDIVRTGTEVKAPPPPPPQPEVRTEKPVEEVKAPPPTPTPAPTPPDDNKVVASEPPVQETHSRPAPVAKAKAVRATEVFFSSGSTKVNASQLNRMAKSLSDNADVSVTIEGYADPTGNHDDNMTLSQSRAEAVRDYLSSQGVDSSRMEVKAYGDTKLKYGHSDGRNRRVAIVPVK
jgi:outer membrane protein OmpA-like peptidoglycan-associated protein